MADKHANPFTSLPPFSEANPFLPLAEQNPFFQELHSAAPLTPDDVPSLFSSQSGGNATPDLLRIENKKGLSQMDISFDPLISYFEGQTEKDEFEHFAKDRLKPSDEMNETKDFVTPPALLLKTNDHEPSGALGGLMVSDTHDLTDLGQTASASTVETSKRTAAETPQVSGSDVNDISSSSDKPDLTDHGTHGFPEFNMNLPEISFPENSSLEFSELNTLACPYPALSLHSMNEDCSDATTLDHPKMSLISQNCKSDVTQPSLSEADTVDLLPGICVEFSEGVSVNPETSHRPEAPESATDIESVIVHEDLMPFCRDKISGDALEQSTVISDSLGGDLDHQSIEPCHSPQSDIIPGKLIQSDEEFWRSNASLIQTVAESGKSLVETTEPSRIHVQSAQSSLVSAVLPVKKGEKADAVMDTMLQNESGEGLLEGVSSKDTFKGVEDSVPENLFDGPCSPRLSKTMSNDMQEDKQKVSELPSSPCKNDLTGKLLSSISEEEEITHSNGSSQPVGPALPATGIRTGTDEDASDPNSVLSPGRVVLHSLYKSAESDHYLTCVYQQDSISPSLEFTQDVKPKHDWSVDDTSKFESLPNHISNAMPKDDASEKAVPEMACKQNQVREENIKPCQEALPKPESTQESPLDVLQGNRSLDLLPEMHTFTPISAPSHSASSENIMSDMIKSDFDETMLQRNSSGEIVEKCDFSKDMMPIVVTSDMIAELEAQLAPLDTETCLVNDCKTCPTQQIDSQKVLKDESHNIESVGIVSEGNLHLAQLTEPNVFVSDCASDQTSSITQDLVINDSGLKNTFIPQPSEMQLLRSPVANPENAEMWTTPAVQDSVIPDLFPVNWPPLPQPAAPSVFDQPTLASRDDRSLNFLTSSLFDLSPVASSTPHVEVDTNALPQLFPFPKIPPTSVESFPLPELAVPLPAMQPMNSTSNNPFLQDKTQTFDHQSR